MKFHDLREVVERNITKGFTIFYKNPAIFLCERDVQGYLYGLLLGESVFRNCCPYINHDHLKVKSRTILLHTEPSLGYRRKTIRYDISVFKQSKVVDYYDWETTIGIEIKFNRRYPAGKSERRGLLFDIKKAKEGNKQGYILWLNWDRPISEKHVKRAKSLVQKYRNVKLLYLDMFSKPPKTNVKEVEELLRIAK